MEYQTALILTSIVVMAILSYLFKKIDLKGAMFGTIVAIFIFLGSGPEGLVALFLFFVFGSFASSWRKDKKHQHKLAQENNGKRGISNVIANGGVASILSVLAINASNFHDLFSLLIAASFATACSDTLSSELGNVYGKKYYNIMTLLPSKRGLDGVISIPGLWFGVIGSLLVAIGTYPFHHDYKRVLIITLSGFFGNIIDSVLGATVQQKGYINNHQVNFLATAIGTLFAFLLCTIF